MSKHTPGPWKAVRPKEGGCLDQKENRLIGTTINNHLYHIAETFQYRNGEFNAPDGVSIANARLIAAAPDLLDVVKPLLEAYWNMAQMLQTDLQFQGDQLTQRAQAAIANSEGQ